MNDVTYFRKAIWLKPDDKLGVKVFADFLIEFEGYSRWAALKEGAKIRRDRINAREITEAMKLVDDASPIRAALLTAVVASSNNPYAVLHRLIVVAGSRPPLATAAYKSNPGACWYEWTFTVGARWLTRVVMESKIDIAYSLTPPEVVADKK